jgi:uncharacterized protein (DUF58 family)
LMIVLDSSPSMAFGDGITKFRYASIVAASIAYLVSSQGNAVGLMTMAGSSLSYLPARGGRLHLRSLIARLDGLEPNGVWQPTRVISRSAELLKRRGVVILISDLYDAEDETRRELRRVASRGHDVGVVQVMAGPETRFPYAGSVELEDLETGTRRVVDASAVRAGYQIAVSQFLDRCRTEARRDGIDYALMTTDTPPASALRAFLLRRGAGQGDQVAHHASLK